jgi:CubicO group peptidase (beta-lactamase class C family)
MSDVDALADRLGEVLAGTSVPGLVAARLHDGRIESWAWGMARPGVAMTVDTPLQIGSTSKLLAAIIALSAVAEGVIGLDDDLRDVVVGRDTPAPGWLPSADTFTSVRTVLSHRTGLGVHGFLGYPSAALTPARADLLAGRGNSPAVAREHVAGEFAYSGGAYEWLALALESLTSTAYPDLLRARVVEPAGLVATFVTSDIPEQVALGSFGGEWLGGDGFQHHPEHAAAGVWATAADLARLFHELWLARCDQSALLPAELARLMVTPSGVIDDSDDDVGLGCFLPASLPADRWYRHHGRTIGFCSTNLAAVDGSRAAIALTNGFPDGTALGASVCADLVSYQSNP